jgi:hypothetical protein
MKGAFYVVLYASQILLESSCTIGDHLFADDYAALSFFVPWRFSVLSSHVLPLFPLWGGNGRSQA